MHGQDQAITKKGKTMNVSYQIRTVRGKAVFSYDNLERAKEGREQAEKRIGCKMKIVRVTYQEELLNV